MEWIMESTDEIFEQIGQRISADPERTRTEIAGTFKFVLTGDTPVSWVVDCREVGVHQGDDDCDVTITVASEDLVSIANGSMNAMQAFMMGKLQVDGDVGLAMKLQQIL
jgi:putative sterol carrier protein